MSNLLRRDVAASRWIWLLLVLIFLFYGFNLFPRALLLLLLGLGLYVGLLVTPLVLEDRYHTEVLFGSLPLRRSTAVRARYLLAMLLAIFSLAVTLLDLWLLKSLHLFRPASAAPHLRPGWFIMYAASAVVLAVLFLPFYFRFGLGRALYGSAFLLLSAAAVATGLWKFFGHSAAAAAVKRGIASLGWPLFVAGLIGFLILVAGISLRLSIRFYEKRDF